MAKSERQDEREFGGEIASLFRITVGPVLWSAYFLLSYCTTAVFCAKWGEEAKNVLLYRISAAVLTLAVLAAIAWFGWRSWQQWDRLNDDTPENDASDEEDRHQFLGHAAFLLAIISFTGTIYVALPFVFIESCR